MAFSLNPGSGAGEQGGQGIAPPTSSSGTASQAGGVPTLPDSPFLFIQYRNQEKPIAAYVQIVLVAIATASVVICIVLYGYSVYLNHSIENKKQDLLTQDATFKDYPFEEMRRLSQRAAYIKDFMASYVSAKSPLLLLEKVVENEVVFNEFSLAKEISGYTIAFTAITNNYKALIQQLDALNLPEYKKVIISPKEVGLVDSSRLITVKVSSSISVQGQLPEEIDSSIQMNLNKLNTASSTSLSQ